jgi:hypothetical protein
LYFAIDLDSSLVERCLKDAPVDVLEMAWHFFGRHRLVKVSPAKLSDASQQSISRKAEVVPGMMFGCRGHSAGSGSDESLDLLQRIRGGGGHYGTLANG